MTLREGLKSHVTITEPVFARDRKTLRIIAVAAGFPRLGGYSFFEREFCFYFSSVPYIHSIKWEYGCKD
jgi:hypothetical protein